MVKRTYDWNAVCLCIFLEVRGNAMWSKAVPVSQFLGNFPNCGTRVSSVPLLPSTAACFRAEDAYNSFETRLVLKKTNNYKQHC